MTVRLARSAMAGFDGMLIASEAPSGFGRARPPDEKEQPHVLV
jgi:hypothetical protein